MSSPVSHCLTTGAELAAIAVRIGAGDRQAEAELMLRWMPSVREIVRRHCRPGDSQAEDIAQDVMGSWLAKLRARAIVDLRALTSYLNTMIRHACKAHYRAQIRRLPMFGELVHEPADDDPARHAHRQQLAQIARELLAALPVMRDRELLRRICLEEHSPDRVCADLGIDRRHFHRVYHRARTRLLGAALRRGLADAG